MQAVELAKSSDIKIVDWLDTDKLNKYFNDLLLKYYIDLPLNKSYTFKKSSCKEVTDAVDAIVNKTCVDKFNVWSILSENAYEITEKVDKDEFKEIELFFNNRQKDLNNFLYRQLKVSINGRKTSRAWLKMQELLHETVFFNNIIGSKTNNENIKTLHICEAPGNFINSCSYYVTSHTNNMKYDWTAQSLQDSKIYDQYGFIKNNPDKWDFYKGGDVTIFENFMYYYTKYKGSDALISDCGTEWITDASEGKFQKELSVYEMLYALLIPRIGGNFIMKTIASNYNKQFLFLVYFATCRFEKVIIFKSNNNFWSQEIYVIGINNQGLSDKETKMLFNIFKGLEEEKILYPDIEISNEFCKFYNEIMTEILEQFKMTKKFFVFLIDHDSVFEQSNKLLSDSVYKKNSKWLKQYMSHKKDANVNYLKTKEIQK
jgi:hypothetical protein